MRISCPHYFEGKCKFNTDFRCYGNFNDCDIYKRFIDSKFDELKDKAKRLCKYNKCQECPFYTHYEFSENCDKIMTDVIMDLVKDPAKITSPRHREYSKPVIQPIRPKDPPKQPKQRKGKKNARPEKYTKIF